MTGRRIFYALLLASTVALHVFFRCFLTFFLLGLVILIPLSSLMLLFLGSRGFAASVSAERAVQRNTEENLLLSVSRHSRAPFGWAEFRIELSNRMTGDSETLRYCLCISGKRQQTSLPLLSRHAGKIDLKITKARLMDCFGLFCRSVRMDAGSTASFLSQPICRELEWELPDYGENDDEESVAYSQHSPGDDPSEIFDIREYREGDRLKSIHWKLTWKLEQPMVKEFGLPLHSSVEIALELCKASPELLDLQLDFCTSLARFLLEEELPFRITWLGTALQSFQVTDENGWEEAPSFLLSEACRETPGLLYEDHVFLSKTCYITTRLPDSPPSRDGFLIVYCGELTDPARRHLRKLQDDGAAVFTPEDILSWDSPAVSEGLL